MTEASFDDVRACALAMSAEERARLAQALLTSLDDSDPDVASWALAASAAALEAERAAVRLHFPEKVAEACEVLLRHVMSDDGILGGLRPFTGVSRAQLRESVGAIALLRRVAASSGDIPASAVKNAVELAAYVQLWALDGDGMLQRNHLISRDDIEALREWRWKFSSGLIALLEDLSWTKTTKALVRDE